MRILLLEDDRETARAIQKGLTRGGHEVLVAARLSEAVGLVDEKSFEVAILDVKLPDGSGYEVLDRLRARRKPTQVLMLTALGSVADRVAGLDRGADDYLVKPFSFAELTARVRALERRPKDAPPSLTLGALELDLMRRKASADGRDLELTHIEFSLLATLLREHGEVVSRQTLLREIWGYDFDPGTNVIDVHVNRLRRKLEDRGMKSVIQTVRGRGYAAR